MSTRVFVDSNVWVYFYDINAGNKHQRAIETLRVQAQSNELCISSQVAIEVWNVLCRKRILSEMDADAAIRRMVSMTTVVPIGAGAVLEALRIKTESRMSFLDSIIIATAQSARCSTLLTEDMNDGQTFGELSLTNPFRN